MTEEKKAFKEKISTVMSLDFWRDFFMGNLYPAIVCVFVLVGNLSALDYYFNFLIVGLFVLSMLISDSVKPALISVLTFIYQISIPHAPYYPTYSDFLFSGWRKPVSIVIVALVALTFIFFFCKKKIYRNLTPKKTPLFLPTLAFSAALILNGAFSSNWTYQNVIFAFLNIIVYFFFFFLLLYGFSKDEKSEDLGRYFSYITLLIAAVIVIEMAHLFLTSETVFQDGRIQKESVALGWGIWNLIGTSLAVMIPVLFLGVMNNKYPWLYFGGACVTYAFALLSMSRNALLFATFAFALSLIVSCFIGKNKKAFRIITLVGIVGIVLLTTVFFGKIKVLLGDYFESGFSDNGRFELWRLAIETFKKNEIFGNGFYGFFTDAVYEFGGVPRMAHNTILELLSAAGIVGIVAYLWYRATTVMTFVRRPSKMKAMLGLSILTFLFGSLLDNFVFNIHPALYYSVALAIAVRLDAEAN